MEENEDDIAQEQDNDVEPMMLADQRVWSISECIETFLHSWVTDTQGWN